MLLAAVYGTVRTVVREDGGGDSGSYPIFPLYVTPYLFIAIHRRRLQV